MSAPARRRWLVAALVALGLLPWAIAAAGLSDGARPAFATLCHQLQTRTLVFGGAPMVVCSRCAGIYAGVALGALLPLPQRRLRWGRALVMAAVALNVAHGLAGLLGLPTWHALRLGFGLAFGWAAAAFFVASLRCRQGPRRPCAGIDEPPSRSSKRLACSCSPMRAQAGLGGDRSADGLVTRRGEREAQSHASRSSAGGVGGGGLRFGSCGACLGLLAILFRQAAIGLGQGGGVRSDDP